MRCPKHQTTNRSRAREHALAPPSSPLHPHSRLCCSIFLSLSLSLSLSVRRHYSRSTGPQSFVMYVTRSWLLSWHSAIPTSWLAESWHLVAWTAISMSLAQGFPDAMSVIAFDNHCAFAGRRKPLETSLQPLASPLARGNELRQHGKSASFWNFNTHICKIFLLNWNLFIYEKLSVWISFFFRFPLLFRERVKMFRVNCNFCFFW